MDVELQLGARPLNGRLELSDLVPEPQEEWQRMLRFVGLDEEQKAAMSRSIEVLFRRGPELVVQTYEYLRSVPETAAILGWEQEVDPEHLEERRRFFTVWLARTLGLDTSNEFALYLFRAGKFHAGHGPRRIHVPSAYVTGSMGLVLAAFARYMSEAHLPPDVIAAAMAGWSKYLMVQLNQMDLGYRVAKDLEKGEIPVRCVVFGRLRSLLGIQELEVRVDQGASVADVLRKFFNYYPQARLEALDRIWHAEERVDSTWVEVIPAYVPRPGWLFLLNGRDLYHAGGFTAPVHPQDEVAIFPPGR
jgi:molybdopterin converting factor small subunit